MFIKEKEGNFYIEENIDSMLEKYKIYRNNITIILSKLKKLAKEENFDEIKNLKKKIKDVTIFLNDIENYMKSMWWGYDEC